MTTTALLVPALPWGDRTELLPKRMQYVLSLDVEATCNGSSLSVSVPVDGAGVGDDSEARPLALRHLFEELVVTMPEGLRCDVPQATILGGDGTIGDPNDPLASRLELRVRARLADQADALNFQCDGVVLFHGGPLAFRGLNWTQLAGSAYVAMTCETASATYRWLNRRQLFGVGRVVGHRESGAAGTLEFSFDLYAAA